MDWFEKLEHRKASIVFAVTLVISATLTVTSLKLFADFDVYWHLQMGKDWVESGLSPWKDHYSFTYPGSEIVSPPVLFQGMLYTLVDQLGEYEGFFVIRLTAFLLAVAAMLAWLRQIRAPVLVYCLVLPMLAFLLQMRSNVRPELFSYSLIILGLILYQRARPTLSLKTMLPIVGLLLFWTNYHSSILGYVIFSGLFIDAALRQASNRSPPYTWFNWAIWGTALLGIGFLNPGFQHAVLQFYFFPSEWKHLIQEYRSPNLYAAMPAVWVLLLITAFTILMLVKQRKFGFLAIALVFVYAGSNMARLVAPGGIAMLCLFSHVLTDMNLAPLLKKASPSRARLFALCSLLVFAVPLLNGVMEARTFIRENTEPFSHMPWDLTEYMLVSGKTGRIFNQYEVGGYLIHRLSQQNKIYIDGRTGILYPVEHHLTYMEATRSSEVFATEVEKYDIDYALLDDSSTTAALMADAGFELEFVDYQYALYSRGHGRFSGTGHLWAMPFCWDSETAAKLEAERKQANTLFPPHLTILELLSAASEFANSSNPKEYIEESASKAFVGDATRRFLGYRAIELDLDSFALSQFKEVAEKDIKDYLAASLLELRMDRPEVAEDILDQATRTRWSRIDFNDLLIQHALLLQISEVIPLQLFNEEYVDNLNRQVGEYSLPARGEKISVSTFCNAIN